MLQHNHLVHIITREKKKSGNELKLAGTSWRGRRYDPKKARSAAAGPVNAAWLVALTWLGRF